MLSLGNGLSLIGLLFLALLSSYQLILQTYEHRIAFAKLEKLQLQKQELSFKSNILFEEVKFINNQISLRKYASDNLGMIMPNDQRFYLQGED